MGIIQSAVSKMLIKLLSFFTTINYAERLTFSEYENANPLEIMTQRAQKLKKYCGSQKVGFRMNKNAKVTVKEFDMAICVPWKCASQYVKHTMQTFRAKHGIVTTDVKCGVAYDFDMQYEDNRCKSISKDYDQPAVWSIPEIANSETASRVLVVRHPFVRLISAWNDKLLTSNSKQSAPMFRVFRMSRFHTAESPTHRITFPDFVAYLLNAVENHESINRHFQPQSGMCDPCLSNYNRVLKVERLKSDMSALLDRHNLRHHSVNETFHDQKGGFGSKPLESVVTMVQSQFRHLTFVQIELLYEYYKQDFLAFNYTFNFKTLEVGGF